MTETRAKTARLGGPGLLLDMVAAQKRGEPRGVWSACTAHPDVIDATLQTARELVSALRAWRLRWASQTSSEIGPG